MPIVVMFGWRQIRGGALTFIVGFLIGTHQEEKDGAGGVRNFNPASDLLSMPTSTL
jgi:hypothetical protein